MRVLIFHGYMLRGTGSNIYNANLAPALARLGQGPTVARALMLGGAMAALVVAGSPDVMALTAVLGIAVALTVRGRAVADPGHGLVRGSSH